MKKIILFLIIGSITFGEKYIVPELSKNEYKQLIITLKAKDRRYLVKQGDTLESIAQRFKMSVEEICRRNKLESGAELKVGMLILVDDGDMK